MFYPRDTVELSCYFISWLKHAYPEYSGTQNAHIKKQQILETFKDMRIWLVCLAALLTSIPTGGITSFQSILLTTFGTSPFPPTLLPLVYPPFSLIHLPLPFHAVSTPRSFYSDAPTHIESRLHIPTSPNPHNPHRCYWRHQRPSRRLPLR